MNKNWKSPKFGIPLFMLLAGALCALVPAVAFAAEEAEEASGISAILPDMNEFIPMLLAFVVVAVILAKFGWPMFEGMLEKREHAIAESLKSAEEARIEAENLLSQYQTQLDQAKSQAAQIVADAKAAGEAVKADITKKAQDEAAIMIEKAHAAIEAEKKTAISELQSSVADMSVLVASRLIGEDLSDDDHRRIIERYVEQAGSFNAN